MLSQRGIDFSYEAVDRWSFKFGLANAGKLRRSHPRANTCWHLDEVFFSINGKNVYLWRAVDCDGGEKYCTAVYADVAVAKVCASCHNDHKDTPRSDFKVGDVMGGVVIRIPMAN